MCLELLKLKTEKPTVSKSRDFDTVGFSAFTFASNKIDFSGHLLGFKSGMANTMNFKNINEFVKEFLDSISVGNKQDIIDLWEDEENQSNFQALFTKKARSPRKKTKKDTNAPKRGKSAYIFFCIQARPDIKAANPTMESKEITREMGRQWREMTNEDKVPFLAEAEKDKKRYDAEMIEYVPPKPSSEDEEPKAKKTSPKRGKSAYNFFCAEERAKIKAGNEDMNNSEILTELGVRWASLKENNEEEFQRYKALAVADKEKVAGNMGDEPKPVMATAKKIKRARSAYLIFCQEKRASVKAENPDAEAKEITAILAEMWRAVKETDEVDKYKKLAEQDKENEEEKTEIQQDNTEHIVQVKKKPTKKPVKKPAKKVESDSSSDSSSSDSESDSEEEEKPKRKTSKTVIRKRRTKQ